MKKRLFTFAILGITIFSLFGCGKKEGTTEVATEAATTEEATTEDSHAGENYNELTGEWSADYEPKRPVAIMINNIVDALPSSSTKKADIIYECMVEGGITRIMPIFSDYESIEKLGSVRSARHYYINIANEYDAIYLCYGQSAPAKKVLNNGVIDAINGLTYDAGYYRDDSRVAPHNVYTTGERIVKGIDDFEYSAEYETTHEKVLSFYESDTDLQNGTVANTVHVSFGSYMKPYFMYNTEKGLYERYEYGNPQLDNMAEENDNILLFKNVIIQMSSYECINTKNDLQDLKQVGNGDGYYCTNGKAIPITWEKTSEKGKTKYYTEDGEELLLNPGKTWISIIGNGEGAGVSFE